MAHGIIYADAGSEWAAGLNNLEPDIYFSAKYHLSFERSMQRRASAFTYQAGGETFFYPFMLGEVKKIGRYTAPKHYQDTETVYGYSGLLSTTDDAVFLAEAHNKFYEVSAENNIICSLLRFHPLLENHKLKCPKTALSLNRYTVSLVLDSVESLWKNYHPKLRNDIRRAEKMGLVVEENAVDIPEFIRLYENTMQRLDAPGFYVFDREHYNFYKDRKLAKILSVKKDGKIIAASIFLLAKDLLHYHLSANSGTELQPYASKLIIHQAALWGIENGYSQFHLGGGRTPELDDKLLFFKKRFSSNLHDFYIGKAIIDNSSYEELCNMWNAQSDYQPLPYLQFYRLPVSQANEILAKVAV